MEWKSDSTLQQIRDHLTQVVIRLGRSARCPACGQHVKLYHRPISSRQALTIIEVYQEAGRDWCHVPSTVTYNGDSGEISKLRYWGLVEESKEKREDGGRAGWWRLTENGERFVLGELRVPKTALVYDSALIRLEGEPVGIQDALGTKFSYEELMQPHPVTRT